MQRSLRENIGTVFGQHEIRYSLLIHTLSKGPTPELDDDGILAAVDGADVFLDPAIRFGKGDESRARDNQEGLAKDLFGLLRAGARSITVSQHSPKPFAKENVMTLENVLCGTGDIGAMSSAVWGIKQIDKEKTIIHIECIKARDFKTVRRFSDYWSPFHRLRRPLPYAQKTRRVRNAGQ
jgi:hypothetical protein